MNDCGKFEQIPSRRYCIQKNEVEGKWTDVKPEHIMPPVTAIASVWHIKTKTDSSHYEMDIQYGEKKKKKNLTQHHSHRTARGDPHGHYHHTLHSSSAPGLRLLFPLDLLSQASVL